MLACCFFLLLCVVSVSHGRRSQWPPRQHSPYDNGPHISALNFERSKVRLAKSLKTLMLAMSDAPSNRLGHQEKMYTRNRLAIPVVTRLRSVIAADGTGKAGDLGINSERSALLRLTRRAAFRLSAAVPIGITTLANAAPSLSGYDPSSAVTRPEAGRSYFPPLTPPLIDRATYRYELGRGAWALEQLLVFTNVSATIRTVVVKMSDGKLWVNSPQWPTGEFCALLDELGPVGHVVLPVTALEHKAPIKAFMKKYPSASLWIAPGQYGPFGSCGLNLASSKMGYKIDGVLPVGRPTASSPMPPWANEFDMRTLYVNLPENAGPVAEAAFLHKPTKSLITTDSVIYVPNEAPPIFETYFKNGEMENADFWPKSVLQAVFLKLRNVDGMWPGYDAVKGRLLRAPILRAFADARAPDAVREWVRSIASMGEFDRIITSHFASPIAATPNDYLAAFNYLDGPTTEPPIACEDWGLLDDLNNAIETNKLGAPVVYDFKQGCRGA